MVPNSIEIALPSARPFTFSKINLLTRANNGKTIFCRNHHQLNSIVLRVIINYYINKIFITSS
jgi:hypothetical protein